ncbi:unnamed protein product [Linum trigynum]|uniref:Uncharacterized protein n=1 Tax=Linum trigynum TaxID=586398 RepID=A0AAV2GLU9_9ROSI
MDCEKASSQEWGSKAQSNLSLILAAPILLFDQVKGLPRKPMSPSPSTSIDSRRAWVESGFHGKPPSFLRNLTHSSSPQKSRKGSLRKRDTCKLISERLNIPMAQDLGHYLGFPILHGRITMDTYRYIFNRINKHLAGWKADNLSLPRRVRLAMSVLNVIPSYAMQTFVLPAGICDQIDQKIWAFIWGSQQGRRRIHLINWETICLPKDQGGLGLRSARELNAGYHMKLAWTMLTKPEELWVQVLKEKYLKAGPSSVQVRRQSDGSSLWRGLPRIWGLTLSGICWSDSL